MYFQGKQILSALFTVFLALSCGYYAHAQSDSNLVVNQIKKNVTVTLLDGVFVEADSIAGNDSTYYLFRKLNSGYAAKSFRKIEGYEIFSIKNKGHLSILYQAEEGSWNSFEMESFIIGRQIAVRDFKKWPLYVGGFASGFAAGAFYGNSLVSVGGSFAVSYGVAVIPLYRKKIDDFDNPLE